MAYLLDTHVAIWWWEDNPKLSTLAREKISNPRNVIYFSPVSTFEITNKVRLRKLHIDLSGGPNYRLHINEENWSELLLTIHDSVTAGEHPSTHRDPFDRLLAA